VGTKCILWVKVKPDYEILLRLMEGLDPGAERRYWIRERGAEGDIGDIQEGLGQIEAGVKISLPVPHNDLNDLRIDAAQRYKTTPLTGTQPPHNPQLD
jgi:hypothetical protein